MSSSSSSSYVGDYSPVFGSAGTPEVPGGDVVKNNTLRLALIVGAGIAIFFIIKKYR